MNILHSKLLHVLGGAIALLAVYNMVTPSVSASLPTLPKLPTASDMTNLVIGGAIFVIPLFV